MKTIVWDVDDVLNDLMRLWLEKKWLKDNPKCTLKYEDLIKNPPHEVIGTTFEKYCQSLDSYRLTPEYLQMEPNQAVLAWFKQYGSGARHLVLTAVPLAMAHISATWVIKHFGTWIRSFNFIPSKRSDMPAPEYDKNKPEFLKWLQQADLFIEDTQKNVEGVESKSLLVARPWNKSKDNIETVLNKITKMVKTK